MVSSELFEKFKNALIKEGLTGELVINKFNDRERLYVLLGWNYEEELVDKVYDAATSIGLTHMDYSICADIQGGFSVKKSYF
jgi:hypothetical protein